MSKITFRADADLVDRLEGLEGSKSEVMREALREYLDAAEERSDAETREPVGGDAGTAGSLDDALAARVDELVTARLDEVFGGRRHDSGFSHGGARPFGVPGAAADRVPSVNLTVNVDGADTAVESSADEVRPVDNPQPADADRTAGGESRSAGSVAGASDTGERSCAQCGEGVSAEHVYCPNCGEKATRRLFCECGDELRSDWGFCPGCGRRTPAADVLDRT
ncbi:CopG family transcriptional regulator [Halobaculum magnesiiphilum]|uniref:CopG family transcriptional regulator n=1 Tax=Halobaculum magnesiiphilum TaxID=1017351 RepID=A0A8T8WAT7_9EURY|nr:CopG family transcriptional regulator [Halobaculum magnesiiphilum]QZP36946.1 CopG family transcriptional regulator [Halobaculum magnesiiphilum]